MAGRSVPPQVFFAVGLSVFVFVSFLLYANVDTNARVRQDAYSGAQNEHVNVLRRKIEDLERQLKHNDELVDRLDRKWDAAEAKHPPPPPVDSKVEPKVEAERNGALKPPPPPPDHEEPKETEEEGGQAADVPPDVPQQPAAGEGGGQIPLPKDAAEQNERPGDRRAATPAGAAQWTCPARKAKSDVQMLDAYDRLPFDNPDGGVWKQGFEITYDKQKIRQEKRLEVVVIPHSHCDPGWLKTFEEYYQEQTREILNGMLRHLTTKPDMKFIYAEMSFFELWWANLTAGEREKVKALAQSGQFEVVTGGWVMTDEANAHSFAIVMELIEGHEFLRNQLDYRPKNHWSIDPFGLSSTLAKLIKGANLTHMAVQRVHYSVKRFLAETKQLEFRWRQLHADEATETDIRTHMFPFYSYDAPHSCGPDPAICCTFDFKRLSSIGCPWRKPPQRITERNVAARAEVLADQYRKKAQLYRMNTLLVPLGDDFRYDTDTEWEDQYTNYKQLFEYMNSKEELNIHARFGTLKDYFDLLDGRLEEESDPNARDLPVLSGDFFTYADRDDHYWSGYFTSRPFYKHMDRTVQHFVRSADALFSLAAWTAARRNSTDFPLAERYDRLVEARRWLSLFQHHDGVTGTGRTDVVVDYGKKMLSAIEDSAKIPVGGKTADVEQQLQPVVELSDGHFVVREDVHELCFRTEISALGLVRLEIVEVADERLNRATVDVSSKADQKLFPNAELLKPHDVVTLANSLVTATFDSQSGYLTSIEYDGKFKSELQMEFVHYGARGHSAARAAKSTDSLSGAYLFLPDGPAKALFGEHNTFVRIRGAVRQSLLIRGPQEANVQQEVRLDVHSRALEIVNLVDVRPQSNYELAMRLTCTQLDMPDEQFFTDLNALQMIRRKRFAKLPIQAQFYPMPSTAYVEADGRRMTLLGRQALGVASLTAGSIEVMLDRRLNQDDDRGLAEGVLDNKRTESRFRLLIEQIEAQADAEQNRGGFLTPLAHHHSQLLHHPVDVLFGRVEAAAGSSKWSGLKRPLPCDVHLFALRTAAHPTEYSQEGRRHTRPKAEAMAIFQRYGVECKAQTVPTPELAACEPTAGQLTLSDFFEPTARSFRSTSLTGMYEAAEQSTDLRIEPTDLKAVKVEF
ncbi:Alpha-mannosidase [Aphelenchoides fujianensis]|nr:Alpha-mannosidase [Aphelenchoides fujianensis]